MTAEAGSDLRKGGASAATGQTAVTASDAPLGTPRERQWRECSPMG